MAPDKLGAQAATMRLFNHEEEEILISAFGLVDADAGRAAKSTELSQLLFSVIGEYQKIVGELPVAVAINAMHIALRTQVEQALQVVHEVQQLDKMMLQ